MESSAVYRTIAESGIMPTTFVYDITETVCLARTLNDNGVHVIELLQRTPEAEMAISAVKTALPGMTVGAGTILTLEAAQRAVAAGADYVVTPYYNQEIVDWCSERQKPIIPGCATVTEVSQGYRSGLRYFKYFPIKQLGGVEVIRQISEIYSDARYVVTGGISYDDLLEFSPNPYVAAVGTVCMMPQELIEAHDWTGIAGLTRKTVAGSLGMEVAYIDLEKLDRLSAGLAEHLCLYDQARNHVPEIPEDIRKLGRDHIAGVYTNSTVRALAFFRDYGLDGEILVRESGMTPVVADVHVPAIGGRVRLVARHYIYKT